MFRVSDTETPILDGDTYYYFMASLSDLDPFGDKNHISHNGSTRPSWVHDDGHWLGIPSPIGASVISSAMRMKEVAKLLVIGMYDLEMAFAELDHALCNIKLEETE